MKRTPTFIAIILSLIGLTLSLIALAHYVDTSNDLETLTPTLCKISEQLDCKTVNRSEHSQLLGWPIAAWGISFYVALLLLLPASISGKRASQHRPGSFLVISLFSLGFSLYLFLVSELIIKALCPICIALYVVNILLFLTATVDAWSYGVLRSVSHGLRDLIQLPLTLIISKGDNGWRNQYCVLALAISLYIGFSAPDIILSKYLLPLKLERNDVEASKQIEQLVSEGLTAWRSAAVIPSLSQPSTINNGDYFKGPLDAPIKMLEFSDMECPYCRQLYFAIEDLLANYPGKIHFTFRNYPLDQSCNPGMDEEFHMNACHAALFARCAGEQGKFWEALHEIFSLEALDNGSEPSVVTSSIDSLGDELGLDQKALSQCRENSRGSQKIAQDIAEAEALGLQGTPFLVINGKPVENPRIEVIKAIVEDILNAPTK